MTLHTREFEIAQRPALERTQLSHDFVTFWRGLARDGIVPKREEFRPERAGPFLRHLLLCEVDDEFAIRFRLIGSEFQRRVQCDMKGQDFLQYVPAERRPSARYAVRSIITRPCGLWRVTPMHYERGFAQYIEYTTLPLLPGADGKPLLLILTQAVNGLLDPGDTHGKVMAAYPSIVYRYLDIGAGIPS